MVKQKVFDIAKKEVGTVELSKSVFSAPVRVPLMQEAVKVFLANRRAGAASTKTRAEVRGGGAKPYRQKGTGRARHGSWTSPLFVGGGITFGPKPRNYGYRLSTNIKKAALKSALTTKLKENNLLVLDKWVEKKKTKEMVTILNKMSISNALIVLDEDTRWLERVVRNISNVDVTYVNLLTTYNVLLRQHLVLTKKALEKLQERLEK